MKGDSVYWDAIGGWEERPGVPLGSGDDSSCACITTVASRKPRISEGRRRPIAA